MKGYVNFLMQPYESNTFLHADYSQFFLHIF